MNRILLVLCVLLIPITALAGPRIGVEAGWSAAWLSDDNDSEGRNPGWRADFNVAATANFALAEAWSLDTGIRYSRLGNDVDYVDLRPPGDPYGDAIPGTNTLRYQYLGIPVLVRVSLPGRTAPFLFGGTEFAYLVDASSEWHAEALGSSGETGITDVMNHFNMTVVVGAGVTIGMGDQSLELALRYAHGLIDSIDSEVDFGWKTRELSVAVGVRMM